MDLVTLAFYGCSSVAIANFDERRKLQEEINQHAVISISKQVIAQPIVVMSGEESSPVQVIDDNLFDEGLEIVDTRHVILHFKHKPEVVVDNRGYHLPKWNVDCPFPPGKDYKILGLALIRQFVSLYNSAKTGMLGLVEAKIWGNILHDVDYADFCEQIRPALPAVGVLIRRNRNKVVVRLSGGKEEEFDGVVADALSILKEGERFSVMFKRSKGKIIVFEDVYPLKDFDSVIRGDLRSMLA